MKKLNKIYLALLIFSVIATGCESLLDVDSNRRVFPNENQLDSPNDTLYSMIGIFSQLEKLGERYALLGELRGDLMDISEDANPYLNEIYNFNITKDNPYNKIKDYYSVINNCNYLIQNIDTAIVASAEKVMYKEFAAAKAIRAWTYMQLVLNYGTVKYYEEPILSVNDTANYTEYTINELIPALIQDLEPWKNIEEPGSILLGESVSSDKLFIPVRFILGDLYLWSGQYEQAAVEYHDLMVENNIRIYQPYRSTWTVENGVFVKRDIEYQNWLYLFSFSVSEQISMIAGSTEYGEGADLDSISMYYPEIYPSTTAINNWNNQIYYYNANVFTEGDLRGNIGSYISPEKLTELASDLKLDLEVSGSNNLILKFYLMTSSTSKAVSIYRGGLLYLRYAEAVNRAGKPNLAFAVLKYGMNSETLAVDSIVPRIEKYSGFTDTSGVFYDYVNFEDLNFDYNIGVHARGCGNVDLVDDYRIPSLNSLQDSVLYVEDKIVEELALETAFEGNRFHDLMRVALRRNDPAYLADIVSEKYKDNKETIRTMLMDENNWYLP